VHHRTTISPDPGRAGAERVAKQRRSLRIRQSGLRRASTRRRPCSRGSCPPWTSAAYHGVCSTQSLRTERLVCRPHSVCVLLFRRCS